MEPVSPSRHPRVRYVVTFLVLLAVFEAGFHGLVRASAAFEAYLEVQARAAVGLLRLVGLDAAVDGRTMRLGGSTGSFERGCDPTQAVALFGCAVLAFPHGRRRLAALVAGGLALGAINVVRVASLLWMMERLPEAYDASHLSAWPIVLLVLAMGMWFVWARRSLEAAATRD